MGEVRCIAAAVIAMAALFGQEASIQPRWRVDKIVGLEYPPVAAQAQIAGLVEVECILSEDGVVKTAHTGRGNDILARAARDNAMKWRFRQNSQGDFSRAEQLSTKILYTFRISGICARNTCPTTFTFEVPDRVLVEVDAPGWQPAAGRVTKP
jgi:hypothetical protein